MPEQETRCRTRETHAAVSRFFCPLRNRICSQPNTRNPCCRNRLFSGRCQAQSAHGRMGFARWRAVFLLENSRAPPILRLDLPRWIEAPPACAGVPLEGLCWPWTSPDDRGVGWVERGNARARNPMPNARNPCCRNRLFSGRCQAQSAHSRMGFARWRTGFSWRGSRAPPILVWFCSPHRNVFSGSWGSGHTHPSAVRAD